VNIHTISDFHKYVQALAPQAVSTGADVVTGSGVDCEGWEGLLAICEFGAIVDTANISLNAILQESSDDGSADAYADIANAATGVKLNAGENEVYLIELNLSEIERYVRVTIDGGSAGGGLVEITFVLFRGRRGPPTQENTVVQVGFERA
jgi:hypothetical protein